MTENGTRCAGGSDVYTVKMGRDDVGSWTVYMAGGEVDRKEKRTSESLIARSNSLNRRIIPTPTLIPNRVRVRALHTNPPNINTTPYIYTLKEEGRTVQLASVQIAVSPCALTLILCVKPWMMLTSHEFGV